MTTMFASLFRCHRLNESTSMIASTVSSVQCSAFVIINGNHRDHFSCDERQSLSPTNVSRSRIWSSLETTVVTDNFSNRDRFPRRRRDAVVPRGFLKGVLGAVSRIEGKTLEEQGLSSRWKFPFRFGAIVLKILGLLTLSSTSLLSL